MGVNASKGIERTSKSIERTSKSIERASKGIERVENAIISTSAAVQTASNKIVPFIQATAEYGKYFTYFQVFINTANVAAQFIQVYQLSCVVDEMGKIRRELQAATGLEAPRKFASHVLDTIHHEAAMLQTDGQEHLLFLFHPDTDWHPRFHRLLKHERLPAQFVAMSRNLDAIFVWMRFLRLYFSVENESRGKNKRPTPIFHLIIPAYRSMIIKEPLSIPDIVQPLQIHGSIHDGKSYVHINLRNVDSTTMDGVGIWKPSKFSNLLVREQPARVLGAVPTDGEDEVRSEMRRMFRRARIRTRGKHERRAILES